MISVLIPSRERIDKLKQCIEVLRDSSTTPIEVLVYLDRDDRDSLDEVPTLNADVIIVGPRHGYQGLHHYYNALANLATGDWLLMFNDDSMVDTQGWDKSVEAHDPGIPTYLCGSNSGTRYPCFPLISRAAYKALGHFSLHKSNDGYLLELFTAWRPQDMHDVDMHVLHTPLVKVTTKEELPAFYATVDATVKRLKHEM